MGKPGNVGRIQEPHAYRETFARALCSGVRPPGGSKGQAPQLRDTPPGYRGNTLSIRELSMVPPSLQLCAEASSNSPQSYYWKDTGIGPENHRHWGRAVPKKKVDRSNGCNSSRSATGMAKEGNPSGFGFAILFIGSIGFGQGPPLRCMNSELNEVEVGRYAREAKYAFYFQSCFGSDFEDLHSRGGQTGSLYATKPCSHGRKLGCIGHIHLW